MATAATYGSFLSSQGSVFRYTNPSSTVGYPPMADSISVMGPVYLPSVYARDLDNLELASSGAINFGLADKLALTFRKNAANATVIQASDATPISLQPGDTSKTVSIGDLTITGSDVIQTVGTARRVNFAPAPPGVGGASAGFRFGSYADLASTAGGGAASLSLFANAQTGSSVLGSYVNNSSTVSNLTLVGTNLYINDGARQMLRVAQSGNTTVVTAGIPGLNPAGLAFIGTDGSNTVTLGAVKTSTYSDLASGKQYVTIDTVGVNGGVLVKQNILIDPSKTLYVNSLAPTGSATSVQINSGLVINGPLVVSDSTNSSTITWNNVDIRDKTITLSKGSVGTLASNSSGLQIDCGSTKLPSVLWNANNRTTTTMQGPNPDSEPFWRISGGHLRVGGVGTIEYGLRINANLELELFKVKYDATGTLQQGAATVITRWGGRL